MPEPPAGHLGGKVNVSWLVDLAKMKQLLIEGPDGVTRLYGGRIDTKSLFAQDITATGTITGAKLNGVEVNGQQFHLRSQSSRRKDSLLVLWRLTLARRAAISGFGWAVVMCRMGQMFRRVISIWTPTGKSKWVA